MSARQEAGAAGGRREYWYQFGPLEARGALGRLRKGQLFVVGVTVGLGMVILTQGQRLPAPVVLALLTLVLITGGILTFLPLQSRTADQWVPVLLRYAGRRLSGGLEYRSGAASAGVLVAAGPGRHDPPTPAWSEVPVAPPAAVGRVDLLAFPYDGGELGVFADREADTYSAVLEVAARSFALLDLEEKAQRLSAWAQVVASLGRESSPVHRLSWIEQTVPDDGNGLVRYLEEMADPAAPPAAAASYRDLIGVQGPAPARHELYVVLTVHGGRASREARGRKGLQRDSAACAVLARELDAVARRLEHADLDVLRALSPRRAGQLVRFAYDPAARLRVARAGGDGGEDGTALRNLRTIWPGFAREGFDHYLTEGVAHRTAWVSDWPLVPVGPEFLAPLLVAGQVLRRIAVVCEVVPPLVAQRQVAFAKTADAAEEVMRERLGFIGTATRERQARAVARREQEIAEGHADVRFTAYVTVTAGDLEQLDKAYGYVENWAAQARLVLQPCYGEQDTAFTNTLPLGRGLK